MSEHGRPARVGAAYIEGPIRTTGGFVIAIATAKSSRSRAGLPTKRRLNDRDDGQLPAILAGKSLTFNEWADWFLEKRSKPPYRAEKTHRDNLEVLKNLRPVFGAVRLSDITAESIEEYIERRLGAGRRIRTKQGINYRGKIKPATAHKELRVLRRILSVAVKKKRLAVNPCGAVEFPVRVSATTRKPHYMSGSEQERIEFFAPDYLRDVIVILVEMGLRPYKELAPMKKQQVDLENGVIHIADSKTENGVADMPMTDLARAAFERRIAATPDSAYLFPTSRVSSTNLRK